ncbi:hypothetical protein PVT01_000078500 [Plasmodium vivax]|uniref:Vir protein n=1 Tax=Plasmodium vivax TaxID=5855 RepID=A0A1G4ECG5_PLAVI|nr:hypothetical protein PVT01_000078500 [Plasmodium vivax]
MYLNLWLDEQKGKHVNDESDISNEDWQTVENLWETLKREQGTHHQCKRQHEEKNISEYRKRINLISYCMNRDYLKSLCLSSGRPDGYKEQICKSFSDYTSHYYNELVQEIDCIDKESDIMRYKYHISNDCTLYDIPKTFPKCETHSQNIVENDNSKTNIRECKTTAEVESTSTELAGILAEPAETVGAAAKLPEKSDDPAERPEIPGGPVSLPEIADDSARLREFDLQLSPTLCSTNNWPSKQIYYSGLSLSGAFFTSMVLYKV